MAANYLGEEPLLSTEGTPFDGYTPSQWAMEYISRYGQIDGDHHKLWVLDQVARILHGTPVTVKRATWQNGPVREVEYRFSTGTPSKKYLKWMESMQADGYDVGVAP